MKFKSKLEQSNYLIKVDLNIYEKMVKSMLEKRKYENLDPTSIKGTIYFSTKPKIYIYCNKEQSLEIENGKYKIIDYTYWLTKINRLYDSTTNNRI